MISKFIKIINKFFKELIQFIKEEYVFLLIMISICIICLIPVDYYIIIGGGISDVGDRIVVEDGYKSKGSFNLSYVSELKGTVLTYLVSYIIPSWERISVDYYRYNEEDDFEDIAFRGGLELKNANSLATKTAYELANKECQVKGTKIYVIAKFSEYESSLEIQDQILSINGSSFNSVKEYQDFLQTFNVSDEVEVKVLRDEKELIVKTKLYEFEDRKIMGVSLNYYYELVPSPAVYIKFERNESGPSAGLVTTLEIYDQLTKKDITKSYVIAGTGTIEEGGLVGSIGGVEHKIMGAAKGKADIFLVPAGKNYDEAIKTKKEKKLDIDVYAVETVSDAIKILETLK